MGAAKSLHLLAPRFFALWDNPIADGWYGLWSRDARAYWKLMLAVRDQVAMIGGEAALGRNPVKAVDELAYCRFTLGLDLGPIAWLAARGAPSPTSLAAAVTSEAGGWPHGSRSVSMRAPFEQGHSVSEVAHAIGVDYAFAYGVRQRWLDKKRPADQP